MKSWFKRKFSSKKRGLTKEEAQVLAQLRIEKQKSNKALIEEKENKLSKSTKEIIPLEDDISLEIEALKKENEELRKHLNSEENNPVVSGNIEDISTRIQEAKILQEQLNEVFGEEPEVKDELNLSTILNLLQNAGASSQPNSVSVAPATTTQDGW